MKKFAQVGIGVCILALLALYLAGPTGAADKDEKVTIKDVMKKAHSGKPPLCGKVASGKASKEEKEELVSYYIALTKNTPPKGDKDSWKEKTDALVKAAKACAAGDKDGPDALKKAVTCAACHDVHKEKKKKD